MESFLGHMIAGGVFCLFGGQPLTVLGCTGPVSFQIHKQTFCNSFVNSISTFFVFCRCSSLRRSLLNSVTAMVSWKHSNIVSTPRTGIYYLTMRLWIGLWASFFCMIIVAVDGSAIVRYFTRWDIDDSPKIDQTRFFVSDSQRKLLLLLSASSSSRSPYRSCSVSFLVKDIFS